MTSKVGVGTLFIAGIVAISLGDTFAAPLIAAFLGAAIVYNGGKIIQGGGISAVTGSGQFSTSGDPANPPLLRKGIQ